MITKMACCLRLLRIDDGYSGSTLPTTVQEKWVMASQHIYEVEKKSSRVSVRSVLGLPLFSVIFH